MAVEKLDELAALTGASETYAVDALLRGLTLDELFAVVDRVKVLDGEERWLRSLQK